MKVIGKLIGFLFFLLSINNAISQCITIADLSNLFEGEFSNLSSNTYEYREESNIVSFKGYKLTCQTDYYYFNNGDYLNLNIDNFLKLTMASSSCYSKIKASVAKESNSKVSSKEVYSINGFEIEKYNHLRKDLIIEFYKNTVDNKYFVVLMTTSFSEEMSSLIEQQIKLQSAEKEISDRILTIRQMIISNDLSKAELLLEGAISFADVNNLKEVNNNSFLQLKNQIITLKFTSIINRFLEKMKQNKFLEANQILAGVKNNYDNSNLNQINLYQAELNTAAISFYTKKYKEKKEFKNYTSAISYLDSIILFEPNNIWVANDKKELISINTFLQERKLNEYDFWAENKNIKETIFNDFKRKSYSLINQQSGIAAFDLEINTDTSCNVFSKINWRSKPYESILFGKKEQNLFAIKPYEKFGYCGKSYGILSFDLSWTTTNHTLKYGNNKVSISSDRNKIVESYLKSKYPLIEGRFEFSKTKINFNNNLSENIQLTDFHTRGPANALLSFVMPGSGSLIVSYGKKGWGRFAWFIISSGIGVGSKYYSDNQYKNYLGANNQTDINKFYNQANLFNKIAIVSGGISATIYVYDIIWAFSKGCKNIHVSKSFRKLLNTGPVVIQN
jgi:hypothetical protein